MTCLMITMILVTTRYWNNSPSTVVTEPKHVLAEAMMHLFCATFDPLVLYKLHITMYDRNANKHL